MEFKPPTVSERLPTLSADVRLLSGMDTEVPGQCPRVTETRGADRAGVRSLSCVDAKVSLEVLHAVELSVAHRAAEGAAARRVKLQPGPPASCCGLPTALLELLLTLAVVPPQQAGQVERLTAGLAGVEDGVAGVAAGPCMDSINMWRGFWDGSWFCQLEDVWEL